MKFLTNAVLILFVLAMFTGFVFMSHGTQHAEGNCLLVVMGICVPDGLPMAVRHIVAYQAFSNTTLTFALILFSLVVVWNFCVSLSHISRVHMDATLLRERLSIFAHSRRKIFRWLSLFEHSPSFA